MESAEAVTAKRRVLVDALMMCLTKSPVVQHVDAQTVRSVLDTAAREMWRQGEFRLDPIWKILISQPGLTAEQVAPPLLVFKAYENELGVIVRLPQALSAIPRGEQVRLRDALGIQRQDFAQAIEEMRALARAQESQQNQEQAVRDAEATVGGGDRRNKPTTARHAKAKPPSTQSKALAAGLAAAAVVAIAFGTWFALRDTSKALDLSDVTGILQVTKARAVGESLTVTLTDPKWESLSTEERRKAVSAVMDVEAAKGIRSMIFVDGNGIARAIVNETPGGRNVMLPPPP